MNKRRIVLRGVGHTHAHVVRQWPSTRCKPYLQFWQTVVAIRSAELQIPTFQLCPEGSLAKVAKTFGTKDISFDDHSQFSKAFLLKSDAEDETREFFNQRLLNLFAQHPDISLEARPGTVLFFRIRKRIERIGQREYEPSERIRLYWWHAEGVKRGFMLWLEPYDQWKRREKQAESIKQNSEDPREQASP